MACCEVSLCACRLFLAEPAVLLRLVRGRQRQLQEDLLLHSGPDAETPETQRNHTLSGLASLPGTRSITASLPRLWHYFTKGLPEGAESVAVRTGLEHSLFFPRFTQTTRIYRRRSWACCGQCAAAPLTPPVERSSCAAPCHQVLTSSSPPPLSPTSRDSSCSECWQNRATGLCKALNLDLDASQVSPHWALHFNLKYLVWMIHIQFLPASFFQSCQQTSSSR